MLILLLCRLPLFCRVLLEEPLGKVLDGRRAALGLDFAERVIIGLGPNPRLDILGALASDTCFPAALSSRADGIAPFATGPALISVARKANITRSSLTGRHSHVHSEFALIQNEPGTCWPTWKFTSWNSLRHDHRISMY